MNLLIFVHQLGNSHFTARATMPKQPLGLQIDSNPFYRITHSVLEHSVATMMIMLLFALLFDFRELFDFSTDHKDDSPVKLTDKEIDEIGKKVK